ncbi:MAG: hypothetical protein HKN23_06085 [Verrucomicrobiales bacterium]|nr:hypothetical protein [Verrucomicrobiales bacterium]
MTLSPRIIALSLAVVLPLPAVWADEPSLRKITAGGGELNLGKSVPGPIDVAPPAFAILEDAEGMVIAAGGKSGKGRAVAFSHGGFLLANEFVAQKSYFTVLQNALKWAASAEAPVTVGLHGSTSNLAPVLEKAGWKAEVISPGDLEKRDDIAVYCVVGQPGRGMVEADLAAIQKFLKSGGGVLVSATPWPFGNQYPEFEKFPGNVILAGSGLQFRANGYANGKRPILINRLTDDSPIRAAEELLSGNTENRANLIKDFRKGPFLRGANQEKFIAILEKLNRKTGPIIPTRKQPVELGKDPLVDAIIEAETLLNLKAEPGKMYAIPASADYPGAVPDDAVRLTKSLTIDAKYKGWATGRNAGAWQAKEMRSTGLYAPPAGVIEVTVPESVVGKGFEVTIGAYGGGLNNRKKWPRYPRLQRSVPIRETETRISNALGGLITIRVPRGADLGDQKITIKGGVAAPYFVLGKTSVEDWKNTIRKNPAPWAEMESDHIIIALTSDHIRDLEDPTAVMELWDKYLETAAEFAQLERGSYRKERLVFDRLPAAGWMHSGYPVAAHSGGDSAVAVNFEKLKAGSWGFFHEYGHNHQHNLWALPGTGETTCNLWSVYLFEKHTDKPRGETHGAMKPLRRKQVRNAYFNKDKANFKEKWNVWAALDTYLLVQEEFGWEPFKKTFAEYNTLPREQWPKGQQEINDQWVIRLSKHCGKNLAPFWRAWNLPLTKKVDEALKDLPTWENHPVAGYGKNQ